MGTEEKPRKIKDVIDEVNSYGVKSTKKNEKEYLLTMYLNSHHTYFSYFH